MKKKKRLFMGVVLSLLLLGVVTNNITVYAGESTGIGQQGCPGIDPPTPR